MPPKQRYIVHVDMDAFFAAIEQRDNPSLKGKPVVVGADPKGGKGRGVVSACSYEARPFGIHSALPISTAFRRCPHAVFLTVSGHKYSAESKKIFKIFERFTPDIEPISIDEAFLDITNSHHIFGTPEDVCRMIKATIKKETGLTASIGMAPNKMTAKIASDLEKPDGLVIVTAKGLLDFLHPLPAEKLWGVGKKSFEAFKGLGIRTIGDLARRDKQEFIDRFGKHGQHVWKLANGIDPRDVEIERETKSIGNEHTFDPDETDKEKVTGVLMALSEKVSRRLRKAKLKGRTVTLKIRFSDFKTLTRAGTLDAPTNFVEDIYQSASRQADKFNPKKSPVRLIGVRVTNLYDESVQPGLFDEKPAPIEKKERLHQAVDEIKDKYGEKAIKHRTTRPEPSRRRRKV